jgi:hypothetical protein
VKRFSVLKSAKTQKSSPRDEKAPRLNSTRTKREKYPLATASLPLLPLSPASRLIWLNKYLNFPILDKFQQFRNPSALMPLEEVFLFSSPRSALQSSNC